MGYPPKRILIVEDDIDIAEPLSFLLTDAGYAIDTAKHGKEALDLLTGGLRPDLILLDLMMPVMTGWEFREKQLSSPDLAEIPVIVLSAAGDISQTARAMQAHYLNKPVVLNELLSMISTVCNESTDS